jgi:AcrR family transcriptional regulator
MEVTMPTLEEKTSGQGKKLSNRELSRRSSLSKLIATARQLFVEIGYEAATVRKIAEVSGLGMGTVFHYISEKRDLIYLIFNDRAEERIATTFSSLQPWQSFRGKMLTIVESHYQLLALEPELGRILLAEIDHTSPGKHYLRHLEIRQRQQRGMETLIAEAQQSGEIRSDISAEVIARTLFFVYSSAGRAWINSEDPTWRTGLRQLAEVFDVVLKGIEVADRDKAEAADPPTIV